MNIALRLLLGITVVSAWLAWSTGGLGGTGVAGVGLASYSEQMHPAPEACVVSQRRSEAKNAVIERWSAGELTLLQAAAWFRLLNDCPAGCRQDFRKHVPGRSDGEKACRQVAAFARVWLRQRGQDSRSEADLRRIEAELASLLASGDEIELPW